ncbi:MAG: 3-methyl-2-oxobutanoate hydroxymethyltransferase [Candidatus Marinimicrobia bacterium]|nr:3-methyl-2-oxobutanoate hydroxymethyltransferase [Candidatus Neomarinimicrobiota bacterium]
MKKVTIETIRNLKGNNSSFATLTAYDFTSATLVDQAGIPLILVGDSAAMVVYGYDTTIPVTMDEMIFLVASVTRGANTALVVADMPFMSYQVSVENAIFNAGRFIKEANAQAVKLEGGVKSADSIMGIVNAGIPVMAHIGLTPQSFHQMSGYKVQGKTKNTAEQLIEDALAVEAAGAFSVVLEGIPSELAKLVTETVSIPTVGIGAGPHCDGQIQVFHDILGMFGTFVPKHTKQYAKLGDNIVDIISQYRTEVETGEFPTAKHSAHLKEEIIDSIRSSS